MWPPAWPDLDAVENAGPWVQGQRAKTAGSALALPDPHALALRLLYWVIISNRPPLGPRKLYS